MIETGQGLPPNIRDKSEVEKRPSRVQPRTQYAKVLPWVLPCAGPNLSLKKAAA